MRVEGISYRARQFWIALRAAPSQKDLDEVRRLMNPGQFGLFEKMQPGEQAHSIAVMRRLRAQADGIQDPPLQDLLVAALLHDVGKSFYPLRIWERVLIVLVEAIFPTRVALWGGGEPRGWRHAFVVASQHPEWGAEMAARVGTASLAVELIRQHQNYSPGNSVYSTDTLLGMLQAADGYS